MKNLGLWILLGFLTWNFGASAQDCTALWQSDMRTGAVGPKFYNGDTYAAYGVFKFKADSSKWFRIKGKFPRSRFLSIESYKDYKNHPHAALFDWQIEPDAGSENPFRDGADTNLENRSYTVNFVPENSGLDGPNTLTLKDGVKIVSFWTRYYNPNAGVSFTAADLPTVEAFDVATGAPATCPTIVNETKKSPLPNALTIVAPTKREPFNFKVSKVTWAGNAAIPNYSYGVSKMSAREAMVIRFKAPTFVNTYEGGPYDGRGDVRYWSLCSSNLVQNLGLACLADRKAIIDKDGYVTVVHGADKRLEKAAADRGINYLPDFKKKNQLMVFLAYRNILANEKFAEFRYQGEYSPRAVICSVEEYLENSPACEWK